MIALYRAPAASVAAGRTLSMLFVVLSSLGAPRRKEAIAEAIALLEAEDPGPELVGAYRLQLLRECRHLQSIGRRDRTSYSVMTVGSVRGKRKTAMELFSTHAMSKVREPASRSIFSWAHGSANTRSARGIRAAPTCSRAAKSDTRDTSTRTRARARKRRLAISSEPKACFLDAPGGGGPARE
jgi:hypothetical protein